VRDGCRSSRQLGALRDLPAQGFDVLAAVLFQEDDRVLRAALIPHSPDDTAIFGVAYADGEREQNKLVSA
jgi:hypothetical protein